MLPYQLATSGDSYEQHYNPLFISQEFPSYEIFWQKFITPMTRRPVDIHFKDDAELAHMGRTANDICIAQLHYSVLRHLIRVYELKRSPQIDVDHVLFGLSSICGAQDVAFELLERFRNPGNYGPWMDKRRGNVRGGREAQSTWKQFDNFPLQNIRDYRNNLIHGRMFPGIVINNTMQLPKIGKELQYFDWRIITNITGSHQLSLNDFGNPIEILTTAWTDTMAYIESRWTTHLLPNI